MESSSLQEGKQNLIESIEQRIRRLTDPKTLKLLEKMLTPEILRYVKKVVSQ
jgi:hypothetical protein